MALPRSGSRSEVTDLLVVSTNLFDLYLSGRPVHPTVEAFDLHRTQSGEWVDATLEVACTSSRLQIEQTTVYSPESGQMEPMDSVRILPLFYEYQNYELVIEKKNGADIEFYHESPLLRQAVKPKGKTLLTGNLNFQNEVGYTDFHIRQNGETLLEVRLEIFPSKLEYKDDYRQILDDVNQQVHNLAFDFLRKTYQFTGLKETKQQSHTEFFSILRAVFQHLVRAVERVQRSPHHRLVQENRVVAADKVKRAGKENVAWLSKRPHLLERDDVRGALRVGDRGYRPEKLIESRRRLDYDTAENRFLKWALQRIEGRLKEMRARLHSESKSWRKSSEKKSTGERLEQIERMRTHLSRLLRSDFLQEVGEMRQLSVTLVLQMAPGYREVYKIYLMLIKGLQLQGDLFRLSLKDVAQLYEYWCFLKIHSLLAEKYELVSQDILRVKRGGLFVKLDRTEKASVHYVNPQNGEQFTLYYNRLPKHMPQKMPTLNQRPDNVLTLKKHESDVEYSFVFDAKYRIDPALADTYYGDRYRVPGPPEDEINTMHRYRDAIVHSEGAGQPYQRMMYGAYVLFPYGDEEQFKEHPFYKSIEQVNVGAFPFLPNATGLLGKFLDELILDSPEKAFERSTQPKGTRRYYENKLGGPNVLVGGMRGQKQFAVNMEHRFYHLPLQKLKDHSILTQLEYVALYQSEKNFKKDSGIRWYGRITSWSVVPRGEIAELPARTGTEGELYVRFEIESWETLKTVIEISQGGVQSHLLTTKYLLDRARTLAELRLLNEQQQNEWRELRRRGQVEVELDREHADDAEVHSISLA